MYTPLKLVSFPLRCPQLHVCFLFWGWGKEIGFLFVALVSVFLKVSLTEPGAYQLAKLGQQASGIPACPHHSVEVTDISGCCLGTRELNSGPHAFLAGTSTIEPSPQYPKIYF